MANTLSSSLDKLTGMTATTWRKTCVMPPLTDMRYDPDLSPKHKGESVTLIDVDDMAAQDVVPGYTPSNVQDVTNVTRDLKLTYYKEVTFRMTGKEISEVNAGIVPRAYQRAIEALAEAIDTTIFLEAAKYAYQAVGTPGTTPFASDITILNDAARMLKTGKTPTSDRFLVIDEFAEANALKTTQFREADKAGTDEYLRAGVVGQAAGFEWYSSNNVPTFTSTASGSYAIDAAGSTGDFTIVIDNAAGALPTALAIGEVFTIAGSTQTYTVTSYTAGATEATVGVYPKLDQDVADGDAITVAASHKLNLAFHRDSIACASRPNVDMPMTNAVEYRLIADPMTGMVLDLRVQDYHRLSSWSIGCLWGVVVVPKKEAGIVRVYG